MIGSYQLFQIFFLFKIQIEKEVKLLTTRIECKIFFRSKRTIRYDVIDKYASWLKQRGIKGVLVNGTTGEGVCQRVEERKQNFLEWMNACRKYELKCMVQVGGTAVATVHDLAEHAEQNGADAVLCLPELFFKPTCEEDLVDYLKKIAEHCPTRPLFYYHFPAFSKVNCTFYHHFVSSKFSSFFIYIIFSGNATFMQLGRGTYSNI